MAYSLVLPKDGYKNDATYMEEIMYIETPRMIIRDFILEDAADLHDIFGDDETMENCESA